MLIKLSLKFVAKGPINNFPSFVQVMAWRRWGDKPLSEPMMVRSPTHICATRPQWVKLCYFVYVIINIDYIVHNQQVYNICRWWIDFRKRVKDIWRFGFTRLVATPIRSVNTLRYWGLSKHRRLGITAFSNTIPWSQTSKTDGQTENIMEIILPAYNSWHCKYIIGVL